MVRNIFLATCSVHFFIIMLVFFIGSEKTNIVIMATSTPVIFASRMNNMRAYKVTHKKGTVLSPMSKKIDTQTKKVKKFKSLYPMSSLKDKPKSVTPNQKIEKQKKYTYTPIFSSKKLNQKKEEVQEDIDIIKEEELSLDDVLTTNDAQIEESYDAVYSALSQNWKIPIGIPKGLCCIVSVTVIEDGSSTHVFIKKSGVLVFDMAVRAALLRTQYPPTIKGYTKRIEFRS